MTAAAFVVAVMYDLISIPGDDEHHTAFAIFALTTWGTQLFVYYRAYGALHEHDLATAGEVAGSERVPGVDRRVEYAR